MNPISQRAYVANTISYRRKKGVISPLEQTAIDVTGWGNGVKDIGICLAELLGYIGEYLSYYQDLVATEAYLETARQRHSVRKFNISKIEQTLDATITKYAISDLQSAYVNCKETKESVICLFSLLPKIYQKKDEDSGGALKALLQVMSEQVEILNRDIEQLFKEWYIDSADPWEVPYIGDCNIENAFLRRIKFLVQFPFPTEEERLDIWNQVFPQKPPLDKVNFEALSKMRPNGENIKKIALTAAFLLAENSDSINMEYLREAPRI